MLRKISRYDKTRLIDLLLIIYLVAVTFYGKKYVPVHSMFIDRYPLIFPLLLIFLYKLFFAVFRTAKKTKDSSQKRKLSSNKQEIYPKISEQQAFKAFPKKHYLTALLILLAVFCVKSYIARGITTHINHPDEEVVINDILRMMSMKTLDYERYNYPPFFYYSNYVLFSAYYKMRLQDEYGSLGNVPHYPLYEFGRQINAAYGALFAAAVFILCYQIFGLAYGLIASFAVTLSPLRLNVDSMFRTQPAADFYVMVVFIILISVIRNPKTYKFAILGALTAVAICSFFLRVVVIAPVAVLLLSFIIKERRWTKKLTVFSVSFLLLMIILLFPALKNLNLLEEKLTYQRDYFEHYSKYQAVLDRTNTYQTITTWTIKDGVSLGIFILAAVGFVIGLLRKVKWVFYVYSIVAAQYLFVGSYYKTYNRYSSFIIPFLLLTAFLALTTVFESLKKMKWVKEKAITAGTCLLIMLFLIPFMSNFSKLMRETATPHNLDIFLEWRKLNEKTSVPALSLIKSVKLKGMGVIVIPEIYLIKPKWESLTKFISKRYKYLICGDMKTAGYFQGWKLLKKYDENTGKGGKYFILENSIPLDKLKKDTKLTQDKIPEYWKQF